MQGSDVLNLVKDVKKEMFYEMSRYQIHMDEVFEDIKKEMHNFMRQVTEELDEAKNHLAMIKYDVDEANARETRNDNSFDISDLSKVG